MWTPPGRLTKFKDGIKLNIDMNSTRILYQYDYMPMIMIDKFMGRESMFLCTDDDIDEDTLRYICKEITVTQMLDIKDKKMCVLDFYKSGDGNLFIVDMDSDFNMKHFWFVNVDDISAKHLPNPGIYIHP